MKRARQTKAVQDIYFYRVFKHTEIQSVGYAAQTKDFWYPQV